MINEAEYNALQKAKRNAEYLAMLDESKTQLRNSETIAFNLDELKAMANFTFTAKAWEHYVYFDKWEGVQQMDRRG